MSGVSKAFCGSGTQKPAFPAPDCACCLSDEKKDRQMNPIHDRQFIACLSSLLEGREFTALGAGKPKCFVCRVSFSAETPASIPYVVSCGRIVFLFMRSDSTQHPVRGNPRRGVPLTANRSKNSQNPRRRLIIQGQDMRERRKSKRPGEEELFGPVKGRAGGRTGLILQTGKAWPSSRQKRGQAVSSGR